VGTIDSDLLSIIGDPDALEDELNAFRSNAATLSSHQRRLITDFPERWVAIHGGGVVADSDTLAGLIELIEQGGLPRGHVIIRYIDAHPRKMIL
jgi:hypothetical protein